MIKEILLGILLAETKKVEQELKFTNDRNASRRPILRGKIEGLEYANILIREVYNEEEVQEQLENEEWEFREMRRRDLAVNT
jgi:hypothetical protein